MVAALTCAFALLVPASGARAALSWSGPIGRDSGGQGQAIAAVACPAAATCVAVTDGGGAVEFDPASPAAATPVSIDSEPLTGLACLSTSECVAIDGEGNAIVFDPANPAAATTADVDSGNALTAIACMPGSSPSGFECVAVDSTGSASAFDPGNLGGHVSNAIDTGLKLLGIACPGAGTCVAIDSDDREFVLDVNSSTQNISTGTPETIDSPADQLTALTCPSATLCLAFDNVGQAMSENPQAPGTPNVVEVDPGHSISAATCESATQCTAVDSAGNAVSLASGQGSTVTPVAPGATLAGISCPSQCVSGDGNGHVYTFAASGAGATGALIDSLAAYSAVACPSSTQCTAMDNFGDEATFDPANSGPAAATSVDGNADVIYAIACPSVTQCTAVDDLGEAATFDPRAPSGATVTTVVTDHPLLAVACPSVTQCTAVDDDRYAATFNPQAPTSASYVDLNTPANTSLVGVSCPSAAQCSVLDGAGDAVTFDPQAPGRPAPTSVLSQPGVAISCPSATECVAVGAEGDRVTFDPQMPSARSTSDVDSAQPAALSCPSATYCVGLDSAGAAFEFDPRGTGATGTRSVGDPAQLADLACPSILRCVVIDYAGTAFAGTQAFAGTPVLLARPEVGGGLVPGDRLSVRGGTWRNGPTSYTYQWQRCVAADRGCRSVPGATAATYGLTAADVAHTLRVIVTGANALGPGSTAITPVTKPVSGPPTVSRAALTDPRPGKPALTLELKAAKDGPLLRRLTVGLPAGASVSRGLLAADSTLSVSGRKVSATLRRTRGGFQVVMWRATKTLRLRVAGPGLVIGHGLAARIKRPRGRKFNVTVAVGAAAGLRTTKALRVTR